ncbi:hypothetical protein [Streptomyces sp. URMC 129]|uniref:hypothetical protein n=1 Tax=Streptomyces sp. URMC 129 TaxID=3423407 RepID=UPI003F1D9BD4
MPDARARRLVCCDVCGCCYEQGLLHTCPPPAVRLPNELAGMDLDRLSMRQWSGTDCVLCAAWLGNRLTGQTRRVAEVSGCVLRACAPHCPPRGR